MLVQQQKLQLSEYSSLYSIIVPQDNLLRKINDLIDFSAQETGTIKGIITDSKNGEILFGATVAMES